MLILYPNRARQRHERGAVVLVYGALIGLVIVGASVAATALAEHRLAQRTVNETQAFYHAEAGLDNAIVQLRADPDYTGTTYAPLYDAGGNEIGGYSITVTDIGNNQREITVLGEYPENDPAVSWYAANTVEATATVGEAPLFTMAAFGDSEVEFTGNGFVDSYDSRNGPYGGANVGSNGDVGTNSTGDSQLELSGNAEVRGDAFIGPGGDPHTVVEITGNATLQGQVDNLDAAKAMNAVEVPGGLTNLGDLSVSGNNTVTLAAGTYYYDDISVSGNGNLVFTGAVTLYASGQVSVSGNGITTASNLPTNLVIYVENPDDVTISGNGDFYGAIYAPLSDINVSGNGDMFGALIGEEVEVSGNGDVHYDEALEDIGGGNSDVTLDLWLLNPSNS